MKVGGEPVVFHSSVSPKLVSKSFECDNDTFDSGGMKLENQNEFSDHLKGNEEDANRSLHNKNATNGRIASNHDCSDLDDFKDDYDEVLKNSPKAEFFEEDSDFFMEKSIIECQLPELIVCYKENICNIVKDICIDEGVPSQDKLLYDSNVDEKAVCTILLPDKDWNDKLTREPENTDVFTSCYLEHSESSRNKYSTKENESKDLNGTPEAEYDVAYFIENDMPNLSMTDFVAENSQPSIDNNNEVHPQSEQISSETANSEESISNTKETTAEHTTTVSISGADESISNTKETTAEHSSTAPASEEPENCKAMNDPSYNSNVDSGNITFNFNSLASTGSDGIKCHDNEDFNSSAPTTSASENCEEKNSSNSSLSTDKGQMQCDSTTNSKCVEYEDLLKLETGISEHLSVSNRVQRGVGEASFASVGHFGSLLCNSGRIGYSGSISLRSDSSTTSTRSFAFPILQSEWNSSPVRMAKADRRHFRKHRSWKRSLMCCRF